MLSRRHSVAAVMFVFAVAACAPSSPDSEAGAPTRPDDDVTLQVWGWRQEDAAEYEKIFRIYEEAHPGVTVEYVPYLATEYDTILRTGLSGRNGPDVAQLRSYGLLQPLVDAGRLVPLDDEVEELAAYPEAVLDGARGAKDGKIYGVPFAIQTLHVIYNKQIFDEYDLEPPTLWSEMIDAFETLQDAGVIPLAATVADTWMLPIQHEIFGATTYGGTDYLQRMLAGEADFTDRPWVKSIETWLGTRDYWEPDARGVKYTDAQALFSSGAAAMFPGGIWELAVFKKANPDLEMGIFNVPPPPGAASTETLVPGYVDGSFGVAANSDNKEEALDLVRWMATKEFGQAFSDELRQISAVPGVAPRDKLLAQALESYRANPSPYVTYAYFSGGEPTAWDLASAAYSKAALGESTAEEAARHIQQGVDQWFVPQQ